MNYGWSIGSNRDCFNITIFLLMRYCYSLNPTQEIFTQYELQSEHVFPPPLWLTGYNHPWLLAVFKQSTNWWVKIIALICRDSASLIKTQFHPFHIFPLITISASIGVWLFRGNWKWKGCLIVVFFYLQIKAPEVTPHWLFYLYFT